MGSPSGGIRDLMNRSRHRLLGAAAGLDKGYGAMTTAAALNMPFGMDK
jgi:hypothetical protein